MWVVRLRIREKTQMNSGCVVASLDRKRLGADFWGGAGYRTEAFSIRRLGGSRWGLRRTRCAMGFERQSVAESSTGRTLVNWTGGMVMAESVADAFGSMRGPWYGSVSPWDRQTNASMCRSASQEEE